ncbi:MAG: DNA repair protein, partial [Aeromonas sp.]
QDNYNGHDEGHFKSPESDRQAIQMLQLVKKLRALLRVEHNKGKIDPQAFAQEDRRLELMLLKINIANLLKRAMDAHIQGQYGSCRQLYTKGLTALGSVSDKDPYLLAREEDIRQGLIALDELQQQNSAQDLQNIKDKETDELDVLFQPKKKW